MDDINKAFLIITRTSYRRFRKII